MTLTKAYDKKRGRNDSTSKRKFKPTDERRAVEPMSKMRALTDKDENPTRASFAQSTYPHSIESFISQYTAGDQIGAGASGYVVEGVRKADGKPVAIKYLIKNKMNRCIWIPGETRRVPMEVALMQLVSAPPLCENVLELLDWFESPVSYLLILERPQPCMDLFDFCGSQPLPGRLPQIIMWQVLQALQHCHTRGVFHRDVKPENILINTENLDVKLIDFGCGEILKATPYRVFRGTPLYSPPEAILEDEHEAFSTTTWSLGVLLYVLVCGDLPFRSTKRLFAGHLHFPDNVSKACRQLIRWCLSPDPDQRPTITEIQLHQWFIENLAH